MVELVNLETEFLGAKMRNPTVLASGFMGVTGLSLASAARNGAGAVTIKSLSLAPRAGHKSPVVAEFDKGLINAVGLSNPGVDAGIEELTVAKQNAGVPVIASIFADTVENYGKVAKRVVEAKPDLLEVNISCPNVQSEFGTPFAADPKAAANVTKAVKKAVGKMPVLIKLAPVPHIALVAKSVEAAGADGLTCINTLKGMVINAEARRPILTNKFGGMSGPALKPLALGCVYECYDAVKIPILGLGGVTSGRDAVEMMMAGASAVGVGSALRFRGPKAFQLIADEMKEWMEKEGFNKPKELVGLAHEKH
ncbi:dihydroorotate dehydrogenase [Candidatus Micrarchaeota archaeon]|nr:dihydroorotate dehydrogenase [Candidatus Micrarchaeota archaeon]